MTLALRSGLLGKLPFIAWLTALWPWPDPAKRWTVWIDRTTDPVCWSFRRCDAERALLQFPDHDYMYIESPSGGQYAWNPFRASWEWIG